MIELTITGPGLATLLILGIVFIVTSAIVLTVAADHLR